MGQFGQRRKIGQLQLRIRQCLGVHHSGRAAVDLAAPVVKVDRVDPADVDAPGGKIAHEQVAGVAVYLPSRHEAIARPQESQQRRRDRTHAGRGHEPGRGAFQIGDLARGGVHGRIAETAVPVLDQATGLDILVGPVVEEVRDRVVDWRHHRTGAWHELGCPRRAADRLAGAVARLLRHGSDQAVVGHVVLQHVRCTAVRELGDDNDSQAAARERARSMAAPC